MPGPSEPTDPSQEAPPDEQTVPHKETFDPKHSDYHSRAIVSTRSSHHYLITTQKVIFHSLFTNIVNGLEALGKTYKESEKVMKILRSLLSKWHTKINLTKKLQEGEDKKKKSIALKATTKEEEDVEEENPSDEDDDLASSQQSSINS
ncbi:hypothetical protein CK203_049824 [Vitis vinifera]|uniref:Uncharacterized protein n=1 Tax=Vitis vinifera TaxID=29760 RepID=A0A438GVU1_VITVI|nr:hypothetical protein CK203_049824 [Vitis vinifera]